MVMGTALITHVMSENQKTSLSINVTGGHFHKGLMIKHPRRVNLVTSGTTVSNAKASYSSHGVGFKDRTGKPWLNIRAKHLC